MSELGSVLPHLWPEVHGWLSQQAIASAGCPFIRYLRIAMPDLLAVEVGIPTAAVCRGDERIACGELPPGRYAKAVHMGPFDGLAAATGELLNWANDQELIWDMRITDGVEHWNARLESYITDPGEQPDPARWETHIEIKLA